MPPTSWVDLLTILGDPFNLAPLDVPALDVLDAHIEDVTCGGIHRFEPVFPYKDIQGEIGLTRLTKMEDQVRSVSCDKVSSAENLESSTSSGTQRYSRRPKT